MNERQNRFESRSTAERHGYIKFNSMYHSVQIPRLRLSAILKASISEEIEEIPMKEKEVKDMTPKNLNVTMNPSPYKNLNYQDRKEAEENWRQKEHDRIYKDCSSFFKPPVSALISEVSTESKDLAKSDEKVETTGFSTRVCCL